MAPNGAHGRIIYHASPKYLGPPFAHPTRPRSVERTSSDRGTVKITSGATRVQLSVSLGHHSGQPGLSVVRVADDAVHLGHRARLRHGGRARAGADGHVATVAGARGR